MGFTTSLDLVPLFIEKVRDIVGLYLNPAGRGTAHRPCWRRTTARRVTGGMSCLALPASSAR